MYHRMLFSILRFLYCIRFTVDERNGSTQVSDEAAQRDSPDDDVPVPDMSYSSSEDEDFYDAEDGNMMPG